MVYKIRSAEKQSIIVMAQIISDNFDFAMNEHTPAAREQ